MQEKIRGLRTANDPFWSELNSPNPRADLHLTTGHVVAEDIVPDPDDEDAVDDSDVSLQDVIAATHQDLPAKRRRQHISTRDNGGLVTNTDAEDINQSASIEAEEEGRGKRKKKKNTLYCLADFKRHWDNEASDVE
jgi:formate dehydrogenase assembly factor FdhD